MKTYDENLIDGALTPVSGRGEAQVHNAFSAEPTARVRFSCEKDVDAAVAAAAAAGPGWQQTRVADRAGLLRRFADALAARADAIAAGISCEVGMPLKLSRRIQVDAPIAAWRETAGHGEAFRFTSRVGHSQVEYEPVGIVGAITPWNYPLHQITGKVAPALVAGCTVVLKPSELAPTAAHALMEAALESGLPQGVLNIVLGDGTAGAALVADPRVAMVSFTGSTAVGRRLAASAAGDMKRLVLELGGKSACIVQEGADLAAAVKHTVGSCFLNSGQTCNALTRLLVPVHRYEEARQLLVEAVGRLTLGDPLDPATRMGPLISAAQRERVLAFIDTAVADGFDLVTGGRGAPVPATGFFVAPTVFGRVAPASRLAQEEVFGPVLSVITYETEEEAIAIANGTPYGLAGAVWAADDARALKLARQLKAGQVDLNGAPFNPAVPFGGVKLSGIGRENGEEAIRSFLEPRAIQMRA